MKVLVCASFAGSLHRFRGELLKTLKAKGFEVIVAAPDLCQDATTVAWLRDNQIQGFDVSLARTGLNPIRDLITLHKLRNLMKSEKVDIYIGYMAKPVIWGILAARLASVPKRVALITGLGYAFTGQAIGKRYWIQNIVRKLYKIALNMASHILFQNIDDHNDLKEFGLIPENTVTKIVNGSGVDTDHYNLTQFPSYPIKFLLIARILGDKGIREYVNAAKVIREKYVDVEFHLVGGIDDNPNAIKKEEVESWVVDNLIIWHGNVDDVRPLITSIHVYVLPSYREGTPRSVLEAMSMGRPVITTDAPGCRETVIEGQNGFLVDVKSVDQLVIAMERFIKHPELIQPMGMLSRQIACQKYNVHTVNDAMLKAIGIIKE